MYLPLMVYFSFRRRLEKTPGNIRGTSFGYFTGRDIRSSFWKLHNLLVFKLLDPFFGRYKILIVRFRSWLVLFKRFLEFLRTAKRIRGDSSASSSNSHSIFLPQTNSLMLNSFLNSSESKERGGNCSCVPVDIWAPRFAVCWILWSSDAFGTYRSGKWVQLIAEIWWRRRGQ